MNITLADRTNDEKIIHPISLTVVNNDSTKFLSLPSGPTNKISDQTYFSKSNHGINTDYNSIFYSHDYFFIAVFNAHTFDEKIEVIRNMMKANSNKNTVALILERLNKVITNINDKKMQELVSLYSEYYKKYEDTLIPYSELYDKIKNML